MWSCLPLRMGNTTRKAHIPLTPLSLSHKNVNTSSHRKGKKIICGAQTRTRSPAWSKPRISCSSRWPISLSLCWFVKLCFEGADRVAANGDTANKIGTHQIAIVAKHFGVPFYVCAPFTSVDMSLSSGQQIVIEERPADEMLSINGIRIAAKGEHYTIFRWAAVFSLFFILIPT